MFKDTRFLAGLFLIAWPVIATIGILAGVRVNTAGFWVGSSICAGLLTGMIAQAFSLIPSAKARPMRISLNSFIAGLVVGVVSLSFALLSAWVGNRIATFTNAPTIGRLVLILLAGFVALSVSACLLAAVVGITRRS